MDYLPSMAVPTRLYLYLLSSRRHYAAAPPQPPPEKCAAAVEKSRSHLLALIRGCVRLALHAIFILLGLIWSNLPSSQPPSLPPLPGGAAGYAGRALSQVLDAVTRVPASSRKYELVRALADRIVDENFLSGSATAAAVNRAALSLSFSRTIRRLQSTAIRPASGIVGGVRSRFTQWVDQTEIDAGEDEDTAEKLAAELLWLAEKMVSGGAAGEAVAAWGAAADLAQASLSSSPRLQAALVKISVFLLHHAEKMDRSGAEMAARWLPLLCRGGGGVSSGERAAVVAALEGIIAGLSWGEQEEMLTLWLRHFAATPTSDWPDLQPCYARWYAAARRLVLQEEALLGSTAAPPDGGGCLLHS